MLKIVPATPQYLSEFCEFLKAIAIPAVERNFLPHPLSATEARRICSYAGKDEYYLFLRDEIVVGYGLLRGWDENFAIPSLGLCIHPAAQGLGLGQTLLHFLVSGARTRGAKTLILRVKRDNAAAITLYEKAGFVLKGHDAEYLRGELSLASSLRNAS